MKIIIQISLSLLLCLPAVLGRRQSSLDWRTRGRVEVARCRAARCLPTTSSSSSQESCWSLCDSPASQWFSPSNRVEELTRSSRSGQVWELSQSLTVTGCEVRWGQLEISRNSYRTLIPHHRGDPEEILSQCLFIRVIQIWRAGTCVL